MITLYSPTQLSGIKGLALVIHGLNLKPERMESIIEILTGVGIKVALLSLCGHGDNFLRNKGCSESKARMSTLKNVSYGHWREETFHAYQVVKHMAAQQQLPIYFVGYSLGGLLGCDLLASRPEVQFDKMALFAPAITAHALSYSMKLLKPFSRIVIPSATPRHYRCNSGTPVAAYLALLSSISCFKKHINPCLNVPTLVFIDKYDEMVSYKKLNKFVTDLALTNWKIRRIRKKTFHFPTPVHHLITDAESVGQEEWIAVKADLLEHINHNS
jgi:esterase/lipase